MNNSNIKTHSSTILLVLLIPCVASAQKAANQSEPHIGYLYPAGGQQGHVVYVSAGGQSLRGAAEVYVSGRGVQADVVKFYKPIGNLKKEERQLFQQRFMEVRDKRLKELGIDPDQIPDRGDLRNQKRKKQAVKDQIPSEKDDPEDTPIEIMDVKMPEHPLLEDLDNKSLRELAHIRDVLFTSRQKQQINRQLAEMVLIRISIDPGAEPGNRELRILAAAGLTNPILFQVGQFPEICELEPNNQKAVQDMPQLVKPAWNINLPEVNPIELPAVLNGQILPGDVDRFRFRASRGQKIVIETNARSLIPYLADAVPGWFQAVLALYDDQGHELAYADDFRFNPDPVLYYEIDRSGDYELQICDSLYRGREDFVYRISVSERPFITQMFPLGGEIGMETVASIEGWNLNKSQLTLDTQPGGEFIRYVTCENDKGISNPVAYAVNTLDQYTASEPDDTIKTAQEIHLPVIIDGRIDKPGDIDIFKFTGRAGDKVVAEVYGRRLNSPVDSLLRLTDISGEVLAWNDDYVVKDSYLHKDITGLVTHHADSYMTAELPKEGTYYVHIADSQQQGGDAYSYRLRVGPPQDDYELRVTPSSLFVHNGGIVPLCVHVLRKDGFDGEINVALKSDYRAFILKGGRIPAGCDRIYMTLEAPPEGYERPVALDLQGSAQINGQTIRHDVVPADDVMQAFLYRHLVPSQEFLAAVKKPRWRVSPFELVKPDPIRINAGDSATIRVKTAKRRAIKKIDLELIEPPAGVILSDVTAVPDGLNFKIETDKSTIGSDIHNNLIVEAFAELQPRQREGKSANKVQRVSMGVLPAIPIEIIKQPDPQS